MQRVLPELSSVIPKDVVPLVSYALSEHPLGLDPLGKSYETDSIGFGYTSVMLHWEKFSLKFYWDKDGFWIMGYHAPNMDYMETGGLIDNWRWPLDPMDRLEAARLIDTLFESVLGSKA